MAVDGVVYMIQGNKHAVVLAVSVWTLRKHWDGPVTLICADDNGFEVAGRIVDDQRSGCDIRLVRDAASGRNSGYLNKTRLVEWSPYDRTVFLDADTTVHGKIDGLFPHADEMVLTTFSNWTTKGHKLSERIKKWSEVEGCQSDVGVALKVNWPMINTGVMGFTPQTLAMADWHEYTSRYRSFICDEIAMQLMFRKYPARLLPQTYNCSPLYGLGYGSAVVRHYHGKKHLKNDRAKNSWLPEYHDAVAANFGCLKEWTPAGDRALRAFIRERRKNRRNLKRRRQRQ